MFPSVRLLQHACRITLFTRANCQLCVNAKQTLSNVWDVRPFEYEELDVMTPEGKIWRDLYEFDTPVVSWNGGEIHHVTLLTEFRFMLAVREGLRSCPSCLLWQKNLCIDSLKRKSRQRWMLLKSIPSCIGVGQRWPWSCAI